VIENTRWYLAKWYGTRGIDLMSKKTELQLGITGDQRTIVTSLEQP
jgi:hypothetical protein